MMKIAKRLMCFFFIFILFLTPSLTTKAETIDEGLLTSFIADSVKDGYLNSHILIEQKRNNKFELNGVISENIQGMDLGFYLIPEIKGVLDNVGFETFVETKNNRSILTFKETSDDLGNLLNRISLLPFINIDFVTDGEDNYIISGNFNTNILSDIREENKFVDDIFNTNNYTFRFKPYSEESISNISTTIVDGDDYLVWAAINNESSEILLSTYSTKGIPIYIILILVIIIITTLTVIFFNKKKKKNNYSNNSYDDNYNYYNEYNNNQYSNQYSNDQYNNGYYNNDYDQYYNQQDSNPYE